MDVVIRIQQVDICGVFVGETLKTDQEGLAGQVPGCFPIAGDIR